MTDRKLDPASGFDLSRRAVMSAGAGGVLAFGLGSPAAAQIAGTDAGPRFNALGFGATGNGRTDDTAALKRVIAAAIKAGGGRVYLPQGTYRTDDLHIGRNGNGRRPSARNVHICGDGVGVTILRQNRSAGDLGCVTLIDAAQCSVRDLTIDSSRVGRRGKNGGLLLFGCQDCLIENVEVRNSSHRTISVAGSLFGIGRLPARNTVLRNCIGRGQRYWNGNAAAQLIASDGARATTFVDCMSFAERFDGDLIGADDAPATVFRGCRAFGDGVASAGFWIEHHKGERPAFLTDCYVENTKNVGIGGVEGAERMHIQNCHLYRVGKNAIWSAGTGRLFVDGSLVEDCGRDLERPTGTILLNGGGSITNTRVANGRRSVPAVSVYSADKGRASALVHIDGCVLDGDLLVLRSAALTVNISATTFLERSTLVIEQADKTSVSAANCLFLNEGITLGGVQHLTVTGSVFRRARGYSGAAITGISKHGNPVTISNCTFFDYRKIRSGPLDLYATGNRFERTGETLADARGKAGTMTTHRLRLRAGRAVVLPGLEEAGLYLVLVAGVSRGGPSAAFVVTTPVEENSSMSFLFDRPAEDSKDRLRLVHVRGKPALSYPRATALNLTVIAATDG